MCSTPGKLKEAECERHQAMSGKPAMIATQEGHSFIGGMIEKHSVESDRDMAEAGDASGMAGHRLGKTTCVSFMAASEQCEHNKNGK